MEVVPTNDGDDDDGVVWFRCPQCQGFLPKLKGALEAEQEPKEEVPVSDPEPEKDESLPWDSPAQMMDELKDSSPKTESDDDVLVGIVPVEEVEPKTETVVEPEPASDEVEQDVPLQQEPDKEDEPAADAEPIMEYAGMLAELDVTEAAPYRPWEVYEVGQCINHLAWNDCGVVVAKEELPGGRKIIKCYFEEAGVVRLIEQAPR